MKYTEVPKYVKCLKGGIGVGKVKEVVGKIYDTSIPNEFSVYTWEQIFIDNMGSWIEEGYLVPATYEEFKGEPMYEIY